MATRYKIQIRIHKGFFKLYLLRRGWFGIWYMKDVAEIRLVYKYQVEQQLKEWSVNYPIENNVENLLTKL